MFFKIRLQWSPFKPGYNLPVCSLYKQLGNANAPFIYHIQVLMHKLLYSIYYLYHYHCYLSFSVILMLINVCFYVYLSILYFVQVTCRSHIVQPYPNEDYWRLRYGFWCVLYIKAAVLQNILKILQLQFFKISLQIYVYIFSCQK